MGSAFRLGIDFGTSNTVAVLRWPDGRCKPLLFDGSPLLQSGVYAEPAGELFSGREAAHSSRVHPERFEPNPKRRIDDGTVLLGDAEVPVVELISAVLRRVAAETRAVVPGPLPPVTLTCPAAWGSRRRSVVRDAANRAGLPAQRMVTEPVAAAGYFIGLPGVELPVGSCLVVYDFGGGTFDASVVRRTGERGFEVLVSEGLTDAGGLDVDAAVLGHLAATYAAPSGGVWDRLERPRTVADRRARRLLWEDVRGAKEVLSRSSGTLIPVPLLDVEAPLGREQLERLARPVVERTVAATRAAIRTAGVAPGDVAAIFLVGGASRMPLVATMLHAALGVAPTAIEQPELVVAEGAVHDDRITEAEPAIAAPVEPPVAAPVERPVAAPVEPLVAAAVESPVEPSVAVPVEPPVAAPVEPPIAVPVESPVQPPARAAVPVVAAPVPEPVSEPVPEPVPVPVPARAEAWYRSALRAALRNLVAARTWRETLYLVLNLPMAVLGLVMLLGTLFLGAPAVYALERARAGALLHERIPWIPMRLTGRVVALVVAHLVALLFLGYVSLDLVLLLWAAGLGFTVLPLMLPVWVNSDGGEYSPWWLRALVVVGGLVILLVAPWIIRGLARVNAAFVRGVLGRVAPSAPA